MPKSKRTPATSFLSTPRGPVPSIRKRKKKKAKKKTYVIVHDNNNVLVFTGGRAGYRDRTGYHLPGGSQDGHETSRETARREVREETGFDGDALIQSHLVISPSGIGDVHFVVQRVDDVAGWRDLFRAPHVAGDGRDDPFTGAAVLSIAECLDEETFTKSDGTDWFGAGIAHAHEKGHFL
jgi:8-oxo-dGTP pyrophosphatase MutT (NUDIX family)